MNNVSAKGGGSWGEGGAGASFRAGGVVSQLTREAGRAGLLPDP